jgi:hypothetical protein
VHSAPLRWSIAGLALERLEYELHDESAAAAVTKRYELQSLSLGAFDPEAPSGKTALELRAQAPGMVREFALQGTFERADAKCSAQLSLSALGIELPQGPPLDLEGTGRLQFERGSDGVWTGSGSTEPRRLAFDGVRFDPAGPALSIANLELGGLDQKVPQAVLGPLGIEVGWKAAQVKAQLDAAIREGALSAHLRGLAFTDGEQRHASVDEIALEGWKLAAGLRELGTLRVRGVACELGRDEKGALLAFGMRVGPRPAAALVA